MRKSTDRTDRIGRTGNGPIRFLGRLARDQRGAVAIWVGLTLTVFIGSVGLGVDAARGYMVKARLSQALDAAALAGAKSLGSGHVKADIDMFFKANFPATQIGAVVTGPTIAPADPDSLSNTSNTIKLSATAKIDTTLMAVLGFKEMTVAAEATAVRGINGLDVVIAIDVSGSMCDGCDKIEAAQEAARILVNTVYADPAPKEVTLNGTTYSLLNIGMVPWGGKVNVSDAGSTYNVADVETITVPSFTNPITEAPNQTQVYRAKNFSDVLLLSIPPAGWKGGVYARYMDYLADNDNTNDADLKLGYGSYGTGATKKDWVAYEPILPAIGEPVSNLKAKWDLATGGSWGNGKLKRCGEAYWNDSSLTATQAPQGTSGIGLRPTVKPKWAIGGQGSYTDEGRDCTPTPVQALRRLTPIRTDAEKKTMIDAIDGLHKVGVDDIAANFTQGVQGLFWAWEVLMPGKPFDEAKAVVPFARTQAIIYLTDGILTGKNGDSYKGAFGYYTAAATTSSHGKLADNSNNNLNNRLKLLAKSIKGANPALGTKIYVVQYDEPDATLTALLKAVATEPNAPYYYQAASTEDLKAAFRAIAASLSVLRLEK